MAKLRILKRQNAAYLELPAEMSNYDELELFQLRDGYYLLSIPLGQRPPAQPSQEKKISDKELLVLKKLLSIRFENRTPAYVSKALSENDKAVLSDLEEKGLVNVFKGTKYKDGVYNIRDSIYPVLSGKESPQTAAQKQDVPVQSAAVDMLNRQGFIIIADRREAKELSEKLSQQMKSGMFVGVKGFDGRFYVATRNYLASAQKAILTALKDDMDTASIAEATKLNPDGCLAALHILAENGDVIEKKRGIFAPV